LGMPTLGRDGSRVGLKACQSFRSWASQRLVPHWKAGREGSWGSGVLMKMWSRVLGGEHVGDGQGGTFEVMKG
jgi:hypothetical protein